MTEYGNVVEVEETIAGGELTADANPGATVLQLNTVLDFNEDGGTLIVGDAEVIDYLATDPDAATVTLVAGLASPALAGDPVSPYPLIVERVALVDLDDDGDGISARVPHALFERLPEGSRSDDREAVTITRDGSAWVVEDVLGREPLIDASFIDVTTLPAPSTTDGLPPAASPTPDVIGGVGVLHVRWPAVVNDSPVTYELHVSTADGFTPGPATLATATPATSATIRALADGTALTYGVTYFVKLVARDDDAAAAPSAQDSAALYRVGATEISSTFAYIGDLVADQITGGTLSTEVTVSGKFKTADTGQRVVLDAKGVHLFNSADKPIVDLPTDAGSLATFNGTATMTDLGVSRGLTLQKGATAAIAQGAALELASALTPPSTGPDFVLDHAAGTPWTLATDEALPNGTFAVVAVTTTATDTWVLTRQPTPDQLFSNTYAYVHRVHRIATVGGAVTSWEVSNGGYYFHTSNGGGIALDANGKVYLLVRRVSDDAWTLRRYSIGGTAPDTFLLMENESVLNLVNSYTHAYGLTIPTGSTTGYVALARWPNDPETGMRNAPAIATVTLSNGNYSIAAIAAPWGTGSVSLNYFGFATGVFDYADGITRHVINQGGTAYVFTISGTTLVRRTNDDWPVPTDAGVSNRGALWWDPAAATFKQAIQTIANVPASPGTVSVGWKTYTGIRWTTESAAWQASYTWRDSNPLGAAGTSETPEGVRTPFTMLKRHRLQLTAGTIPTGGTDDPNSVSFYVGRAPSSRTDMHLQGGVLPDGQTVLTLTSVSFVTAPPPDPADTTLAFPTATPGLLRSAVKRADGTPKAYVDGLGVANLDGLIPPGSMMMWPTLTAPTALILAAPTGWLLAQGQLVSRTVYPDLFAAIGTTFGVGDGTTTFALPDFRGRFPLGYSPGAVNYGDVMGDTEGDLGTANRELRMAHDHSHTIAAAAMTVQTNTTTGGTATRLTTGETHSHGGATGTGSALARGTVHPYLAVNFIIKF